MDIQQINARLRTIAAKMRGEYPRVSVVTSNDGRYGVYASTAVLDELYKGHGEDLAALLDACEAAIDAAHPDMLARTLGVEVAA